jgi:hypothetical protein
VQYKICINSYNYTIYYTTTTNELTTTESVTRRRPDGLLVTDDLNSAKLSRRNDEEYIYIYTIYYTITITYNKTKHTYLMMRPANPVCCAPCNIYAAPSWTSRQGRTEEMPAEDLRCRMSIQCYVRYLSVFPELHGILNM